MNRRYLSRAIPFYSHFCWPTGSSTEIIGDQQPEILGDIICLHIFTIGAVGKVVFRCLKVWLVVIVTIKQQRFHSCAPPSLRAADNVFLGCRHEPFTDD